MAIELNILSRGGASPESYENAKRIVAQIVELADVVAELKESELYRVKFDSDGGSYVLPQYLHSGETAIEPADPTKEDYTFVAWVLGEETYDFTTEVTTNIELKATWERTEEEITE